MAKKTNCRNCKWAAWDLSPTGRKRYGNWAECTYPIVVKLPASRGDIALELARKVGVREHRDFQLQCEVWELVSNVKVTGAAPGKATNHA